jgi:hypothetical protein
MLSQLMYDAILDAAIFLGLLGWFAVLMTLPR